MKPRRLLFCFKLSPQLTPIGSLHSSRPLSTGRRPAYLLVDATCQASDAARRSSRSTCQPPRTLPRSLCQQPAWPWWPATSSRTGWSTWARVCPSDWTSCLWWSLNGPRTSTSVSQRPGQEAKSTRPEQHATRIPTQPRQPIPEICSEETSTRSGLLRFRKCTTAPSRLSRLIQRD